MSKKRLSLLLCLILILQLWGCTLPEEKRFKNPREETIWDFTEPTQPPIETKPLTPPSIPTAKDIVRQMSTPEQVAQLFLVKCPAGGASDLLRDYHVGGIILFSQDTAGHTPNTLRAKLKDYQDLVPNKLIVAVDEEGGLVNRVSIREEFRSEPFPSVRHAYDQYGIHGVRDQEAEKARLLKDCGINVNLGPVCDLVTEDTAFMADRSMCLTPKGTSEVVETIVKVMEKHGVGSVLKHFPGYGNSTGDTHTGMVVDDRTEEMLWAYDLKPFQAGIEAGVGAVMVNHGILSKIAPDSPACLSADVIHILRSKLDFEGVIITDDITMGAVTNYLDVNEAAVQAILAGCDMIVTAWSEEQYEAVCTAVQKGRISKDRLAESVERIIQWKMDLGLL